MDEAVRAAHRSLRALAAGGVLLQSPGAVDVSGEEAGAGEGEGGEAWGLEDSIAAAEDSVAAEPDAGLGAPLAEEAALRAQMVRRAQQGAAGRRAEGLRAGEAALQEAAGAWAAMRLALRGYLRLDEDEDGGEGGGAGDAPRGGGGGGGARAVGGPSVLACAVCALPRALTEAGAAPPTPTPTRTPTPLLQCSRCKAVAYCSREHQKQHWGEHKVSCAHCGNTHIDIHMCLCGVLATD
jgi:hypothetical protein